jgi:5-methylcytosine-specific restriction endonuclease McrA
MKTCTQCKIDKPLSEFHKHSRHKDGLANICKLCKSVNDKEYRLTHLEQISSRKKEWYNQNLEHCSAKRKEYYKNNKEHLILQTKEWQQAHPEYRAVYKKQWNAVYNHKPEIVEYKSQWAKDKRNRDKEETLKREKEYRGANKERILKMNQTYRRTPKGKLSGKNCRHRRRALIGDSPSITEKQWNKILMLQDVRCNSCKRKFGSKLKPTMDHIIPLSKGGLHSFENIQALCKKCNSTKQAKIDKSLIVTWITPNGVVSNAN